MNAYIQIRTYMRWSAVGRMRSAPDKKNQLTANQPESIMAHTACSLLYKI